MPLARSSSCAAPTIRRPGAAMRPTAARSRRRSTGSRRPHAVPAEVRLYDHLFTRESPGAEGDFLADLNPASLEVLKGCMVEPALATPGRASPLQFERQGYFCLDPDGSPARPVFNRTVALRDSWARINRAANA